MTARRKYVYRWSGSDWEESRSADLRPGDKAAIEVADWTDPDNAYEFVKVASDPVPDYSVPPFEDGLPHFGFNAWVIALEDVR